MAVAVIVGIIVTFATLSVDVGGADRRAEEAAQRFRLLASLAREQAILESRQLALVVEPDGYRFERLDGERWRPLDDNKSLRPRHLDADLSMRLTLDGEPLKLGADKEGAEAAPRVLFLSSGEVTPFEVELRGGGQAWRVRSDGFGTLSLDGPLEPAA